MKTFSLDKFPAGRYEEINDYKYFVPEKINREWTWKDATINKLLEDAARKIGMLNSFSHLVPYLDQFLQLHLTNEAVYSSRIEGTRTEIEEAILSKEYIAKERRDDWQEVHNYIEAMNYAIERLKYLPLSTRLIRETHKILLSNVRGTNRNPGEFRHSQNWIGGLNPASAMYVPPLHNYIPELMSDLENFIHNDNLNVPHLIKIAIIHYQFESIHPFLDGNGRIGRLLITLYLIDKKLIDRPLLALSVAFEKNKLEYYYQLNNVRKTNILTEWVKYFLTSIIQAADFTAEILESMIDLKNHLEQKIREQAGQRAGNASKLLNNLFKQPSIQIKDAASILGLTYKSASELVNLLTQLSILQEITHRKRNRLFVFDPYVKLFKRFS